VTALWPAFGTDLAAQRHPSHLISIQPNGCLQQIAAKGLSVPPDAVVILLHRLVRRDVAGLLGKEFLILVVVADPVPEERVVLQNCQSSVTRTNTNGPNGSALLESQGRMPRGSLPKTICSTCSASDVRRKTAIRRPKVSRCR
jgi:hypothetical protein